MTKYVGNILLWNSKRLLRKLQKIIGGYFFCRTLYVRPAGFGDCGCGSAAAWKLIGEPVLFRDVVDQPAGDVLSTWNWLPVSSACRRQRGKFGQWRSDAARRGLGGAPCLQHSS